jgi:hypothetical protein
MKELDAMRMNAPQGHQGTQVQSMPQQTPVVTPPPTEPQGQPVNITETNPATGLPFTPDEREAMRQEQVKYQKYHGFISVIANSLTTHLNDPEKDGYDFAEWFIAGNGRLMYDQVKTISPDDLLGALRTYTPLWQVIGGAEDKVKQFVGEFLTVDDLPVSADDDSTVD